MARQKNPALPTTAEIRQMVATFNKIVAWYQDQQRRYLEDTEDDGKLGNGFHGERFVWEGNGCDRLTRNQRRFLSWLWNNGLPRTRATLQEVNDAGWMKHRYKWKTFKVVVSRLDRCLNEDGIYLGFRTHAERGIRILHVSAFETHLVGTKERRQHGNK